ncbi:hypothetical protein COW81_01555 [Candidatus Campbellbacteria bacterium CG22_combo_CG10-13_8_21_14_all_36_13]|uniref:Ribosome-binding factor A n=1 Tax=Candidatus Campbellbacteria bacterium CG22_combo_CG10-13_8_21_14_all_36_13 TaxID=1974529 RepID=A0A2H0DZS1_9BACT|nr:MAG: hypothetical protein COW81_01555 [Candidatus Campbellbacteria bacterium CG22_combo_CG10-13_8_21_14_all_36_13]
MSKRQDKVNELLRQLVSEFISKESNRLSLITVTHVDVSRDLKKATIYVSIYPEDSEEQGIDFLKRNLGNLRDYVKPKLNMKNIPFFDCKIDIGEKNRQVIEDLSHES